MARPRKDGTPSRPITKRKFTDAHIRNLRPESDHWYLQWDSKLSGLAIAVHPTGKKSWKVVYQFNRKSRWVTIGPFDLIDVDTARKLAAEILLKVVVGVDVAAERQASRGAGTFAEISRRYVEEHAKKKNKSWAKADRMIRTNVLPKWGDLRASDITRSDAKLLLAGITAPSVAIQVKLFTSAIFNWCIREQIGGIRVNPCSRIETEKLISRERVLSDVEVSRFWSAFDEVGFLQGHALRLILLTGQRPGEVQHMNRQHIEDGWWTMPGKPDPELNWPGTKNSETHRVWLPKVAQDIVNDLDGNDDLLFKSDRSGVVELTQPMRDICKALKVKRATPHDLRRTHGTLITGLGFGRDSMNRIQNHKDGGIASVYDRHHYSGENQKIMEAVASRIMQLVDGVPDKVVVGKFNRA